MKLSLRVPLGFALVLSLSTLAGLAGMWTLGRSLDTFEGEVLERVADERATAVLESHFKTQVQEWKDTLLRGSDAALLAKYWGAFQKEEKAVADEAQTLLARQADPAVKATLASFISEHQKMAASYREGFEKFKASGFDSSVGDSAVRGIDRKPAALVGEIRKQIAEQSRKIAAEAYSDGKRAKVVAGGVMLFAAALGLAIGYVMSRSVVRPVQQAAALAGEVARGDLACHIAVHGNDETADLLRALAQMQDKLRELVASVRENAESVATASAQIAQGNQDLSMRTEQQASALQQTAATMDQLGSAARHSADNARQASELADGASDAALKGGEVVDRVVATMKGINDSSRKIADINAVIDGIAFQTNILALNAAVEAARAGEHGRGFAVVASEVRQLAQRSAEAAREIKSLIGASVERVEQGTSLVDEAGQRMSAIVQAIKRVNDIVAEISSAGSTQSEGVQQVGAAVNQMDTATQQNAALVEEGAAAAESLRQQAAQLVRAVSVFRLQAA